ncbi:VP0952 family biofilm-associated protein [Vibrio comitans]
MVFSTVQFFITTLLAIICAQSIDVSQGNVPILALAIPALWIISRSRASGIFLLVGLCLYGFTLSYQPTALSVSMWILFPLLMVAFSKRCNIGARFGVFSFFLFMQSGIIYSQVIGALNGEAIYTLLQMISVAMIWLAAVSWKTSSKHGWWALFLVLPLLVADMTHAALISLTIVGIMFSMESMVKSKSKLLKLQCWTLPTAAFASLVAMPSGNVQGIVLLVWLLILGAIWMTDYILRINEEIGD